ncbi:unnamed protein product [Nesidiocoris tenuis]|uniref:Uncharacterized protein n=1 Tax=Nesidiocoris tenuis TaxID=355587 RepID=A0A6H5H237_9HEMI|nr:unnamed protein product [Nesidiocoris tenuis]
MDNIGHIDISNRTISINRPVSGLTVHFRTFWDTIGPYRKILDNNGHVHNMSSDGLFSELILARRAKKPIPLNGQPDPQIRLPAGNCYEVALMSFGAEMQTYSDQRQAVSSALVITIGANKEDNQLRKMRYQVFAS